MHETTFHIDGVDKNALFRRNITSQNFPYVDNILTWNHALSKPFVTLKSEGDTKYVNMLQYTYRQVIQWPSLT